MVNNRICGVCHGMYAEISIAKHIKKCVGADGLAGQVSKQLHNLVVGDVHPKADNRLRTIIAGFNGDYIAKTSQMDEVIVYNGNWEAHKNRNAASYPLQLRAQLRMAARILLAAKEIDETIETFEDLLDDSKIALLLQIADYIGGHTDDQFKHPYTARDVGLMVKTISENYMDKLLELNERAKVQPIKDLLRLFEKKFSAGTLRQVDETVTTMNVTKGPEPIAVINSTMNELQENLKYNVWTNLAKSIMVQMLIIN